MFVLPTLPPASVRTPPRGSTQPDDRVAPGLASSDASGPRCPRCGCDLATCGGHLPDPGPDHPSGHRRDQGTRHGRGWAAPDRRAPEFSGIAYGDPAFTDHSALALDIRR